jgi:TorA maturation chaperone TorD
MDFVEDADRAEAYRTFADIFSEPPAAEFLATIRDDFELESEEDEEEIRKDFLALLAYPGGKIPPVESLFSEAGSAAADEVTRLYLDAGLTFEEDVQLVPDHISLEFLFMSYLIDTGRPELQQKFFKEHILQWVPDYCRELKSAAKTLFYREIAGIVEDFLGGECGEMD